MALDLLPSQMNEQQFVAAFSTVFEESPWVAETAWQNGITAKHDMPDALAEAMSAVVRQAGYKKQMALIMAHPILGTNQKMGVSSTNEQQAANLQGLSADKAAQLQGLNLAYMEKFNIPFILAVKGETPDSIMQKLQQRLQTPDVTDEVNCALRQIYKIATFRLHALWQ